MKADAPKWTTFDKFIDIYHKKLVLAIKEYVTMREGDVEGMRNPQHGRRGSGRGAKGGGRAFGRR